MTTLANEWPVTSWPLDQCSVELIDRSIYWWCHFFKFLVSKLSKVDFDIFRSSNVVRAVVRSLNLRSGGKHVVVRGGHQLPTRIQTTLYFLTLESYKLTNWSPIMSSLCNTKLWIAVVHRLSHGTSRKCLICLNISHFLFQSYDVVTSTLFTDKESANTVIDDVIYAA